MPGKLFCDYHTHPLGHRLQPYTRELLQPWIDRAATLGINEIAFTDHDRYREGIDFDVLARLRDDNPQLAIRAGIELDNDPVHSPAACRWVEAHWDDLDFVLGSVHFLHRPDEMFDSVPLGAEQLAGKDIDAVYEDYFRRVRELAATGLVDCLAHIDLVKIHGHRPSVSIAALVDGTLELVKERGLAIELSTAGWRKPVQELYPSDEIINLAVAKGIPFTTASDAHSFAQLGDGYERLAGKMRSLGINEVSVFSRHERTARDLADSSPGSAAN